MLCLVSVLCVMCIDVCLADANAETTCEAETAADSKAVCVHVCVCIDVCLADAETACEAETAADVKAVCVERETDHLSDVVRCSSFTLSLFVLIVLSC